MDDPCGVSSGDDTIMGSSFSVEKHQDILTQEVSTSIIQDLSGELEVITADVEPDDNKNAEERGQELKANMLNRKSIMKLFPEKDKDSAQVVDENYEGEPKLGLAFETPESVFKYYERYAKRLGFGIKIFSSRYFDDKTCRYLMLACNRDGEVKYKVDHHMSKGTFKTNCMARIGMKRKDDGLLHLTKVINEHNHPLTPGKVKSFHSRKRKKYFETIDECGIVVEEDIIQTEAILEQKVGLKLEAGDHEAINQFLVDMQTRYSHFFHSINMDEGGRLKNLLWVDGRSRLLYQYFNDVVLFDTTFLVDQYKLPLASITGVDNHGNIVLLGCGLLSDQSVETYAWFLKTWLSCMLGHHPTAIITDRNVTMQDAVGKVFPKSRQRQCLWHITKRMNQHLRDLADFREVVSSFQKVALGTLKRHEFEESWKNMVQKFGLEENEWLSSLYEDRSQWAPVFVKDSFWAGMSITRRGEYMNSFFEEFVNEKTTLKQFLTNYEMILQSKQGKGITQHESFQRNTQLFTQTIIEQQLWKVYTAGIFRQCQEEMKALSPCDPPYVNTGGSLMLFHVVEQNATQVCESLAQDIFEVLYNSNEFEIRCNCGLLQYKGIPCRHILSVLVSQSIMDIPSKLICERWRKDFKKIHKVDSLSNDYSDDSLQQHEKFQKNCLKLAELGMISDSKYKLAVNVVHKAIQRLLADDTTFQRAQPASTPEVETNSHILRFSTNDNRNTENQNVVPLRASLTNNVQFQFFQDMAQTNQHVGYRPLQEWGYQQYFPEHHMPGPALDPRSW